MNRHDFQSASAPLNVEGFPAVWCLPVKSAQCLGVLLQLLLVSALARLSAALSTVLCRSDRLTSTVHMFFHLRDALHQILNCFRHQASDCLEDTSKDGSHEVQGL